jgi:hypothetical protein
MHKARIYLPTDVSDDITSTVKSHVADKHGGFTVLTGQGGWKAPNGDTITEQVEVLEVVGMKPQEAQSTADWVALHSDETEVMWESQQVQAGFEDGTGVTDTVADNLE